MSIKLQLAPGNIWSGDKRLAVFTNPTELAFRKGNLKRHYPVIYRGQQWPDIEAAYHAHKEGLNFEQRQTLLTKLIGLKLLAYPDIFTVLQNSGGLAWIEQCRHYTGARTKGMHTWEGIGLDSAFIRCLYRAYAALTDSFWTGPSV